MRATRSQYLLPPVFCILKAWDDTCPTNSPLLFSPTGYLNGSFNVGVPGVHPTVDFPYCLRWRVYYLDGPAVAVFPPGVARPLQIDQ